MSQLQQLDMYAEAGNQSKAAYEIINQEEYKQLQQGISNALDSAYNQRQQFIVQKQFNQLVNRNLHQ